MENEKINNLLNQKLEKEDFEIDKKESLEKKEKTSIIKEFFSFITLVVVVLVIIIPFKYLITEPFIVDGSSMSPNYETGNYLLVNKMYSTISEVNRGDVLVFVPPQERSESLLKFTGFFDPRKKYIKRVIALPGETIRLKNHEIYIKKINSTEFIKLEEPYIKNSGTSKEVETILKDDEYFMLGDNRGNSYDSEEWGPIRKSDILGKPYLRIFPISQFGVNPAEYIFEN